MIDKNIILGSGAAVLAVFGIYLAVKRGSMPDATASANAMPTSAAMPIYSSIGGAGTTGGTQVTMGSTTLDTSHVGDVAALLGQQSEINKINAQAGYEIGLINAQTNAAFPILARGADMNGRGSDTILYDPVVVSSNMPGGGGAVSTINTNQRLIAGGQQNMSLDYTGTTASTGGNSNAGTPSQSTFTAHLSETLPSLQALAVPGSTTSTIAAPAPAITGNVTTTESHGCFITTAICVADDKPDDCAELLTLRTFRDGFMHTTPDRRQMVRDYYAMAPMIVNKIDARPDAKQIYSRLKNDYLIPAIAAVDAGQNFDALRIYRKMFDDAAHVAMGA